MYKFKVGEFALMGFKNLELVRILGGSGFLYAVEYINPQGLTTVSASSLLSELPANVKNLCEILYE